jgi:hypothetical protein
LLIVLENDEEDVRDVNIVYNTLLFEKYFNDKEHLNYAQREIAFFFYKKFCWSLLRKYDNLENESTEFKNHFQKLTQEYEVMASRKEMLSVLTCSLYKFFERLIHDNLLEKSGEWKMYIRFRLRHFFWIDKKVDDYILIYKTF